jgi:hypothetical protein
MGAIEGNEPTSDNNWEKVKSGGNAAIERWIASEMQGRTCAVVLIGSATAGRKWISYEISKAWNDGKGLVGISVHNLKDLNGRQSTKGLNPFDYVTFTGTGAKLSDVIKIYDPPYSASTDVYEFINDNLASWVEKAIAART